MSFKPLYPADEVMHHKARPIEIFNETSAWRAQRKPLEKLCQAFAEFACLAKYDDPAVFSRAANNFIRSPKDSLRIDTISIEFPYFDEKYQRACYPTADLFVIGDHVETFEDKAAKWDEKKYGTVKAELMKLAGQTQLVPNIAFKADDPAKYSYEHVRPAFNSTQSHIGDLVCEQINNPHRHDHLRRTTSIPIAMYSAESFSFVTPDAGVAEKIYNALQSIHL